MHSASGLILPDGLQTQGQQPCVKTLGNLTNTHVVNYTLYILQSYEIHNANKKKKSTKQVMKILYLYSAFVM